MSENSSYPKLRWPIDIRLEKIDTEEILLLNCPLGISKAPLALIPAVAPVIACLEGNMSADEIVQKFIANGLTSELLTKILNLLDDNLFLATPRFYEAQQRMLRDFSESPSRPAALAGLSYSNVASHLEIEIDRYLTQDSQIIKVKNKKLCAIVSPHIDYKRGSIAYGKTYSNLRDDQADLYVLIGTSHQFSKHLFHLCDKDFESPLGLLNCERQFVKKLAAHYGEDRSFADHILHRREHSLELQVPFIRRLKSNSSIVPILVGGFHEMLSSEKLPEQFEVYDRFAEGLAKSLKEYIASGRRACIIAGVDMAHVGRYFGDSSSLTADYMERIAERDRQYLDIITRQDKKALFSHIAEDMDARRICGFPTMYTVIDTFDRLGIKYEAELFDYRQAVNYQNDCAVTFAGMGMYI